MAEFIQTVIDDIATELQYVAPTQKIFRGLENGFATPHVYVWEPTTIEDVTENRGVSRNKNPKAVSKSKMSFTVHCWGATMNDCQAMRAALREAMKNILLSRGAFTFDLATWAYPEWARVGHVLSQQVGIIVDDVEMVIPSAALDYPAQIQSNDYDTVTITDVQQQSPATSTAGDGILENGEA